MNDTQAGIIAGVLIILCQTALSYSFYWRGRHDGKERELRMFEEGSKFGYKMGRFDYEESLPESPPKEDK